MWRNIIKRSGWSLKKNNSHLVTQIESKPKGRMTRGSPRKHFIKHIPEDMGARSYKDDLDKKALKAITSWHPPISGSNNIEENTKLKFTKMVYWVVNQSALFLSLGNMLFLQTI